MSSDLTRKEMYEKLKSRRRSILLALYEHGELKTREVREKGTVPAGSKELHFGLLEEWGLIEEVGTVDNSGGIPERVWALTPEGCDFVEEMLDTEIDSGGDLAQQLDVAQSKLREHEERLEELNGRFEKLKKFVAKQTGAEYGGGA